MSKEDILSYFYTNGTSYGARRTLAILGCGLLVGLVIYFTYYFTSEKVVYSRKFNWSLVMILLTTEVIMLVISSNIVVSLGMVGALSIVRFRTAIKDSRDTAFLFWAITEGLATSSQHYTMTFTSVLFIAAVVILSSKVPSMRDKYLLIVQCKGGAGKGEEVGNLLTGHKVNWKVRSIQENAEDREIIYELKGAMDLKLADEVKKISGVERINWVAESGETVG